MTRVERLIKVAMAYGGSPHGFTKTASEPTYDLGVLSHEGGHSKVHNRLGKYYSKLIGLTHGASKTGLGTFGTSLAGISFDKRGKPKAWKGMDKDERAKRRRIAALADIGLHTPKVLDEAAASIIGIRDLKRGKVSRENLRAAKAKVLRAFGTYAAVPGSKTVLHGANELAAMKNKDIAPVLPSIGGWGIGALGSRASLHALLKHRGYRVSREQVEDMAKKLKLDVPVIPGHSGGSYFMPAFKSKEMFPHDPEARRGYIHLGRE